MWIPRQFLIAFFDSIQELLSDFLLEVRDEPARVRAMTLTSQIQSALASLSILADEECRLSFSPPAKL